MKKTFDKVICINGVYSDGRLIKNNFYFKVDIGLTNTCSVYDEKEHFLGTFYKNQFISIAEWRNQQIDKILEDD